MARQYVDRFEVADRFRTVDGDFHTTDLGRGIHDVILYSHIAHMEPPEQNAANFRRSRQALTPGGTLVIHDFVLTDDRSGPPFALVFHANMLAKSPGGAVYCESDYRTWLTAAGFQRVRLLRTPGPSALLLATK